MSRPVLLACAAFALLLSWPGVAFAYIDPGSGVVLLQAIIAAGIGIVYKLRRAIAAMWRTLLDRLRR